MIAFWRKRIKLGILTQQKSIDPIQKSLEKKIKEQISKKFAGSLAIRMIDSGSCNACEAECNALSNPYYNLERLGIYFVASPRHADVMLLSGVITFNMLPHVKETYAQIPSPKWIITLGDCPLMQAPFVKNYAISGMEALNLPIAHHIAGCPPTPLEILYGLLNFLENIELN